MSARAAVQSLARRSVTSGSRVCCGQIPSQNLHHRSMATETLFEKIASKKIPSTPVYEDETVYAFRDINPVAPCHIVVVPKVLDGLTQLSKANKSHEAVLGHLLFVASEIGRKEMPHGFRIVINDGKDGLQSVYHLHLHLIGGKTLSWPPGTGLPEGSMSG